MNWLHIIAAFVTGVLLMNSLPHLVSGTSGRPFPTPFARPPGKGFSSSTVNVAWGFANLACGYVLAGPIGAIDLHRGTDAGAAGAGALLLGLGLARHFGRLHGGNDPREG